jgi:hypothetical protein
VFWLGRRPPKRKPGSLAKIVFLEPKEVYFRLALDKFNYDTQAIAFDEYYGALDDLVEKREKAAVWLAATFFAIFLLKIKVLLEFELPFIKVDKATLGYILILSFSIANLYFTSLLARIARYQSLFQVVMDRSSGSEKQHLLLKYPKAFSVFHFHNWITARPKYMHPKADWPLQIILALVCLLMFCVFTVIFFLWTMVGLSIELWHAESNELKFWGKAIICSSWAVLIFSTLLPTLSIRKVAYEHFGLAEVMARLGKRDVHRYNYFVKLINESELGKRIFGNPDESRSGPGG